MEGKDSTAIESFKQIMLSDIQNTQVYIRPEEVGVLYNQYKARHTSAQINSMKTLEQILIGLPLWLLSQQKPSHQSDIDFIRTILQIQEELSHIAELLESLFNTSDSN
jgi:hypothetical protein